MQQNVVITRSRRKSEKLTQKTKDKIAELAQNTELSQSEIAKLTDVERSTVSKVLLNYGIVQKTVEEYKKNRADILSGLQERIIKSITDDEIKKMPVGQRVMAYGIIYDKERLERNQATSITDEVDSIVQRIERRYSKVIDVTPRNTDK